MKSIFIAALLLVGAALLGGAALIYSGAYNVAASEPHSALVYWLLDTARTRSIRAHAAGIVPPADLSARQRLVAGIGHYAEHCATCHAAPGVAAEDMAEGMYPRPPELIHVADRLTPAEIFWVLKHGIKASGMPSWGDHSDEDLWNTVAFVDALPGMTPAQYAELHAASDAAGGHQMHGMVMPQP